MADRHRPPATSSLAPVHLGEVLRAARGRQRYTFVGAPRFEQDARSRYRLEKIFAVKVAHR